MDKKQKYILVAILLVLLVVAMIVIVVKNKTVSVAKTSDVDYQAESEPVAQTGEGSEEVKEEVQEEIENGTDETEVEPEGNKVTPVSNVTNSKQGIYYIKVNLEQNVVTIYSKDEDGEYTIPVRAMVCSTGKATPTSGTYTIPNGKWDRWTVQLCFFKSHY